MKKSILALLALLVFAIHSPVSRASQQDLIYQIISSHVSSMTALDLINWKVGDEADFDVSSSSFGNLGTMKEMASKEEGATGIWLHEETALMGQNDVVEMLMNRADGKVLKMIHNGKEEAIPDNQVEIISQDYTEVTVPAGTFKAMHIVAKTKQIDHVEIWANPQATCLEGTLKQELTANGIPISIQLKSFKRN